MENQLLHSRRVTRVDVLKRAKELFQTKRDTYALGLCFFVRKALEESLAHENRIDYYDIPFFIPLFVAPEEFLRYNHWYWWPQDDVNSRVKFLDSLIEAYKDDHTDLRKIAKEYDNRKLFKMALPLQGDGEPR